MHILSIGISRTYPPYNQYSINRNPVLEGSGTLLLTRFLLKTQNTFERTIFAHVSERIKVVMHVQGLVSKYSQFFEIERVNSWINESF